MSAPHLISSVEPAAEVTRTAIPEAAYHAEFEHITSSGYRPVWVDAYEVNSKVFFNAIFHPADGVVWAERHGMTATQYQGEYSSRTGLGFHPLQIETYLSGNEVRYATIFVKSDAPATKAYHGLAQDQHQQKFTSLTRDGWRPVNISVVESHNKLMYAALYEKRDVGAFVTRNVLTAAEFQTQFDANAKAGRKLIYLDAYADVGVAHFSAIWNEKAAPVFARHGMTASEFQAEYDKQLAEGFRTRIVTGYEDGNSHRFAAIWEK